MDLVSALGLSSIAALVGVNAYFVASDSAARCEGPCQRLVPRSPRRRRGSPIGASTIDRRDESHHARESGSVLGDVMRGCSTGARRVRCRQVGGTGASLIRFGPVHSGARAQGDARPAWPRALWCAGTAGSRASRGRPLADDGCGTRSCGPLKPIRRGRALHSAELRLLVSEASEWRILPPGACSGRSAIAGRAGRMVTVRVFAPRR